MPAEIFAVPYHQHYVLSFPLSGQIFLVNASLIKELQKIALRQFEVLPFYIPDLHPKDGKPNEREREAEERIAFEPTSVVIFVTNGCNLNCKYCFATPKYKKPQFINKKFVEAALEMSARNAARKDTALTVHFSGGEPLLEPIFTRRIAELCRHIANRYRIQLHMGLTTNGSIEEPTTKLIQEYFDVVSFSIDGAPEIQDFQRPSRDRSRAFAQLDHALTMLMNKEPGPRVEIRSTFTAETVDSMVESLDFFYKKWHITRYCFVPLRETRRSRKTGLTPPSPEDFLRHS